jgi:hypothetical protein
MSLRNWLLFQLSRQVKEDFKLRVLYPHVRIWSTFRRFERCLYIEHEAFRTDMAYRETWLHRCLQSARELGGYHVIYYLFIPPVLTQDSDSLRDVRSCGLHRGSMQRMKHKKLHVHEIRETNMTTVTEHPINSVKLRADFIIIGWLYTRRPLKLSVPPPPPVIQSATDYWTCNLILVLRKAEL